MWVQSNLDYPSAKSSKWPVQIGTNCKARHFEGSETGVIAWHCWGVPNPRDEHTISIEVIRYHLLVLSLLLVSILWSPSWVVPFVQRASQTRLFRSLYIMVTLSVEATYPSSIHHSHLTSHIPTMTTFPWPMVDVLDRFCYTITHANLIQINMCSQCIYAYIISVGSTNPSLLNTPCI